MDRVASGLLLASYGLVFGGLIGPLLGQLMHAPRMDVGVCLARMRPSGGEFARLPRAGRMRKQGSRLRGMGCVPMSGGCSR